VQDLTQWNDGALLLANCAMFVRPCFVFRALRRQTYNNSPSCNIQLQVSNNSELPLSDLIFCGVGLMQINVPRR
jgi:hypothetical protein